MIDEQLTKDGISRAYELADKSGLEAACEAVMSFKAERRKQTQEEKTDPNRANPMLDRHMDSAPIKALYFDDNVQAALRENFGDDLFVWRSNFFVKSDGTGENKWHHDRHFENGTDPINLYNTSNHFTLLFALTDVDMDAGRIEYIRGSHVPIPGFDRDIPRHFQETPDVIADRVTPLPLERGQFVMFYSSLLHRSLAFGEGDRRITMAARVAHVGTEIPDYGAVNPAGGAQTAAEPNVYYRRNGILKVA